MMIGTETDVKPPNWFLTQPEITEVVNRVQHALDKLGGTGIVRKGDAGGRNGVVCESGAKVLLSTVSIILQG
jgi:hypothetical protein